MKIGFTGTRNGMTAAQQEVLRGYLRECVRVEQRVEFHHGDCIGADAEAIGIASVLGAYIICHPPINEADRAFAHSDETREAKSYFARNRDIVEETDMLIGVSFGMQEWPTGGTWYTIRYAQKAKKQVMVIWPNGTVQWREYANTEAR